MMATDSRYEDLERRLRTAESDIVGDRHVSQFAAEQARRATDALRELRNAVESLRLDIANTNGRIDAIGENVAAVNAMIVRHGRAIEVLQQDVRLIREETRAGFEEMRTGFEEVRAGFAAGDVRHAELVAAIQALGSHGTSA